MNWKAVFSSLYYFGFDFFVIQEPLDQQELPAKEVMLAQLVQRDHLVQEEPQVQEVIQDLQDHLVK